MVRLVPNISWSLGWILSFPKKKKKFKNYIIHFLLLKLVTRLQNLIKHEEKQTTLKCISNFNTTQQYIIKNSERGVIKKQKNLKQMYKVVFLLLKFIL